jgi:hypothetical protein
MSTDFLNKKKMDWIWWYMPEIPTFGRLRQEDHKLEASLGYIVRSCLKKKGKHDHLKCQFL